MIGAAMKAGYTFDEIDRMTLPQIHFAAAGFKLPDPRLKFESYESFALWRKKL